MKVDVKFTFSKDFTCLIIVAFSKKKQNQNFSQNLPKTSTKTQLKISGKKLVKISCITVTVNE